MKLSPMRLLVAGALLCSGAAQAADIKLALKKQLNLPRIIGGEQTVDGERPWMASLQISGEHFCGGSVIDREWILTAAHCVEDITQTDMQDFTIRVDFTDLSSTGGETHRVSGIFAHEGYAQGESKDIALLKLATPVSDHIPAVQLATLDVMNQSGQPGAMASVSGWGNTSTTGEDFPQIMRNVDVPLVSNEVCNNPKAYGGDVQLTELCAGYPQGGKDSCQGDSGGPLVVRHDGDFVQAGVVSWGDGCALPDKYGVYARVTSFNDWITNVKAGDVDGTDGGGTGEGTPQDGELVSGQLVTGLSGEYDSMTVFRFDVPEGARLLWIDTKGGTGDADLYLSYGTEPDLEFYEYAPFKNGNDEHVLIRRPESGTWYLMIHGYDEYSDMEVMAFAR